MYARSGGVGFYHPQEYQHTVPTVRYCADWLLQVPPSKAKDLEQVSLVAEAKQKHHLFAPHH